MRALNAYNPAFEDYRAVLEPVQVNWKAIIGYDNLSAHVDPWGLPIAGSRIFPDFKNPLDTTIRHKLQVIVKTSAALAGKPVFVKAFDVDDSTSEAFDIDSDGNSPTFGQPVVDTNGKSGNDNLPDFLNTPQSGQFWTGAAWGGDTAQGIVDSNGEAKFDFRVGMQPGNNYRIVASVVDQSMITGVQVTSSTGGKYLGPALAQNAGVSASPLLTVWRRLWVENDSMAAIPVDAFGNKRNDLNSDIANPVILQVSTPPLPFIGTMLEIQLTSDLTSFSGLQNGRIKVGGVLYPITGTIPVSGGIDQAPKSQVIIAEGNTGIVAGMGYRLYDDDDFGIDLDTLPRIDLVNSTFKNTFRPAFVEIINANSTGYNLSKYVDFYRNYPVAIGPQSALSGIWETTRDLNDSNSLWVANLIAAYQGNIAEDKDPISEAATEGITRPNCRYSIVYLEVVRDVNDSGLRPPSLGIPSLKILIERNKSLTAAHEIGHMPGGRSEMSDHNEGGLMGDGGYSNGVDFNSKSIRRFRSTNKWEQAK